MSDTFNVLYGGNPSHYYLGIGIWHTRKDAVDAKIEFERKLDNAILCDRIIEFLNECEESDWELDADDIRHVLKGDLDYIRKQHIIIEQKTQSENGTS